MFDHGIDTRLAESLNEYLQPAVKFSMDCRPQAEQLPEKLPVLALREFVVFPYMVIPLYVARARSVAAVEDALAEKLLHELS